MRNDEPHPDVVAIIRDVVLTAMKRFGGTDVAVVVEPDHDGDLSLYIDVTYSGEGDPVDPSVMAALVSDIRGRLWAFGEERFPYLRHHFPENQKLLGFA